jgi:hypothetical protein
MATIRSFDRNQDKGESVKWWRKAADQGNADAQRELGSMYYSGEGVSKNLIEAKNWLCAASSTIVSGSSSQIAQRINSSMVMFQCGLFSQDSRLHPCRLFVAMSLGTLLTSET